MKKPLLLIMMLVFVSLASAQENNSRLNVRYLKLIDNDTEASRARKTDGNGDKCALIKIQTPNMGEAERNRLEFSADMGTFTYPEKAVGEVKLFLTEGCKTLIILHPEYGKLIYPMPISVQGFKTYEMVLEAKKDGSGPVVVISSNYVLVKATPSDALISIDGNFYPDGSAYISVDEPHDLVVSRSLYHDYEKTIYASSKETMTYEVNLAPAFGWLLVGSSPESGATVLINGVRKGITPYRSDTLASGEYEVTLMREMYENVTKTVRVIDGNESEISIPMKPNFANVTITTDAESDIYVDGKLNARGSWTGRLLQGSHKVEARKASHRTTAMALDVIAGKDESVKLDAPAPIYGALNVTSSPVEATVYLDGTEIGKTPFVNNKVLIGSHELRFVKQGCASLVKTVTVEEGKMTDVSERLQTGREISISTDRQGDQLYADGNYLGASPLTATLSFGTHTIKAVRDSKAVEKTITVSQTGGDSSVRLAFKQEINGHEYVDLGLPSGTLWATCNVGASKPEDYGDYFAWGETATKSTYDWSTYKWCRGRYDSQTKYNTYSYYGTVDNRTRLELADDAARVNWGGAWRMPTEAKMQELYANCTSEWTTQNGVNGRKFTGPNGNSIFLPAAGYRDGTSLYDAGSIGGYWSGSLRTGGPSIACYLGFSSGGVYVGSSCRDYGRSVRPVCPSQK